MKGPRISLADLGRGLACGLPADPDVRERIEAIIASGETFSLDELEFFRAWNLPIGPEQDAILSCWPWPEQQELLERRRNAIERGQRMLANSKS